MSSEESLRQYIIALENENDILRGRHKALCAVLGRISTGIEDDTEEALENAVALLRAAIKQLEGEQK